MYYIFNESIQTCTSREISFGITSVLNTKDREKKPATHNSDAVMNS